MGHYPQAAAAQHDAQVECGEMAKPMVGYPSIDDGSLIGAR